MTLLPGTLAGFPFVEEERAASPRVAMVTGKNVERQDNQEGKTEGGCRRHPEPQGSHCRRREAGQDLGAHRWREIISDAVAWWAARGQRPDRSTGSCGEESTATLRRPEGPRKVSEERARFRGRSVKAC
jgi:hypothetical protein